TTRAPGRVTIAGMLSRILDALGLSRGRKDLRFVSGSTKVRVLGTIVSDDDQRSSVTSMAAAAFEYTLGQQYETVDHEGRSVTVSERFAHALVSNALVLRVGGGPVLVPAGRFYIEHMGDLFGSAIPFPRLPAEIAHGMRSHSRGTMTYSEQFLRSGDDVE